MFIETEQTPNPQTLKFIPGVTVTGGATADFRDAATADNSPLAQRLFAIEGVVGVFLADDFITVTKTDGRDWFVMKPAILGAIMEHVSSGQPALLAETVDANAAAEDDDEVVLMIKELLDTRVRPAVAQDGGDIVFDHFEGGVVYLHLQGSCAGCPSSIMTLKAGIEHMLRHYIPEVEAVQAINM